MRFQPLKLSAFWTLPLLFLFKGLEPAQSATGQAVTIRPDTETNKISENAGTAGFASTNPISTLALPLDVSYQVLANSSDAQSQGSHILSVVNTTELQIRWSEAERLLQQAENQYRTRQFQEALQSLEAVLTICRDPDIRANFPQVTRAGEATTLNNIGEVYRSIEEPQQALEYLNQALPIRREVGDRAGEATTLDNIGAVYAGIGQPQRALEYLNQALPIRREVNDRRREATTLNNIGEVLRSIGQPQQALEYLNQALPIRREVGDRIGEATTLNNIGLVYADIGQLQQALEYLNRALSIRQEVGDLTGEATTLNNIGLVYADIGQPQRAIEYYSQALPILREVGDFVREATTLNNIGSFYRSIGELQQALKYYNQVLLIRRDTNDRIGEATTLNNIGLVYADTGQPQQALEYLSQALPLFWDVGDRAGAAATLSNIGSIYASVGQLQQALEYYTQALPILQEVSDREREAATLSNIGFVYEGQGHSARAIEYYQQAINITESIQSEIQIEELKSSFASKQIDTYSRLINLLGEQGNFAAAFNYTERAKARVFLDHMASGQIDFHSEVDARLLQQERELRSQIISAQTQFTTLKNRPQDQWNNDAIEEIYEQLKVLQREYENLLTQIKLQAPATASLVTVDVAPLAEIQSLLEPDTTLVEYFVTDDRTYAFILTRTSFDAIPLDISRKDLVDSTTLLRAFADLSDETPPELQQLHQALIEPLQEYLKTSRLIIVPHNILHYLPFAAFTDGSRYLSDRHTLSFLTSANALRFLPSSHPSYPNAFVAFGDPTTTLSALSGAQTEVKTIARLFGITPFINREATESRVRSQAQTANILHLAVHAEYNPINPLFSTLYLSADDQNDGRLEVHEIYGLNLAQQTNLVVLSACQTSIGQQSQGDEIIGLNRAFLYAGAPAVMSSLWDVDDDPTALLIEQFYTHLQAGSDLATALQQAQQAVRQHSEFAHPYFWSAFSITGSSGR